MHTNEAQEVDRREEAQRPVDNEIDKILHFFVVILPCFSQTFRLRKAKRVPPERTAHTHNTQHSTSRQGDSRHPHNALGNEFSWIDTRSV